MKVKVTEIEYDIEPEDFEDEIDEENCVLNSDFVNACCHRMDEVIESLPSEMELDIEFDEEDKDEKVADAITDETGWLVKSFKYENEKE